jgi:hypothetical protein
VPATETAIRAAVGDTGHTSKALRWWVALAHLLQSNQSLKLFWNGCLICSICVSSCVCLFETRRLLTQKRGLRRAGTGGHADPFVYMVCEICAKQLALGWECQISITLLCVWMMISQCSWILLLVTESV